MEVINTGKKGKKTKDQEETAENGALDLVALIEQCAAEEDLEPWEGTLRDYLPMVQDDCTLADTAHARLWRMIETVGIKFDDKDERKEHPEYSFFTNELFGINDTLASVMEYLRAAAAGSDVARRILLLYGPTSSGKSQFAILLKEGLEKFSRTKAGRMFALKDCPMHENPLNAVPKAAREQLKAKYGLNIEGDLCPRCAYRLKTEFNGDFMALPVERVLLSEANRVGIGTFQPADPKSQNQSELTGSVNFAKLAELGSESHPLAFDFNGELNKANRGMMEFIELLKVDRKFRHILLTLAQEKRIKAQNFPLIFADLVVISHSVSGDMPVPYRENGLVRFTTMRQLCDANNTNIEVLAADANGKPAWTKVKGFYRHQFSGKMVKTVQVDGVVNTTWHHSLIGKADNAPFLPETLQDVLAFRNVPEQTELGTFDVPVPDSLSYLPVNTPGILSTDCCVPEQSFARVKPTGNKKSDGEYGKYWIKTRYDSCSEEAKDIVALLCWYATEGHVSNEHAIISQANLETLFSLKKRAERVSSAIGSVFDRSDEEDHTSRLHLSARVWREILEHNCGRYSENKRLPDFVFNLPRELREFALRELIKGDGQTMPSFASCEEYAKKYFAFKTTSIILAAQFCYLASSLGYDFGVHHGYTKKGKDFFGINYRERTKPILRKNRIETVEVSDSEVFDIECVDNHSFVAGVGNLVCHNTNETEYLKFLAQKEEEALHDRLWVIKFPYNLRLEDEIKIYEKLISRAAGFQGIHIAPHTLRVAAMFAILSRLEESKDQKFTLLTKMRLYNGEKVDGAGKEDEKRLREAAEREGMDGISPRYIVNRISACFTKHGRTYITPMDIVRSIKEGFSTNAKLSKEDISRFENIITTVMEEYNKIATNEVQKAFFLNFEHEIKDLLNNYIDNVGAYLDDDKIQNHWGEMEEPNHRLMRSVEEKIGITDGGKDAFRQEVYRKMIKSKSETGDYDYQNHPRLKEALQKQLFEERSDIIRLTVSVRNPDADALKRLNEVIKTLSEKCGYTPESANDLLRYVSSILAKNS